MKPEQLRLLAPSLFLFSLLAGLLTFWPALSGPFVFDDTPNLQSLGDNGGIYSADSLRRFVFSGAAGPLGRPLSLLTFVLNDQAWPSDPWSFKYTNLLLHLLAGVLVFIFARQLARLVKIPANSCDIFAALVMAIWLLHPIQLSTMMLVVQRMTILSAIFCLCGITLYLRGRLQSAASDFSRYCWMTAGIACTVPAILSKETGILLPLFLLCLETTILRSYDVARPNRWKLWCGIFLYAPIGILLLYFLLTWDRINQGYVLRDFSMIERLYTEPRILLDYLRLIFLPKLGGVGVFHDDYPWSTGLLSPPGTILSIIILVAVTIVAIALCIRRKAPLVSFAVLWFLAGHCLESSFLSLELYFEHRNYLPLLGIVIALTYYLFSLRLRFRLLAPIAIGFFIAMEIFISRQSSLTWGNEFLLANTWAAENPRSVRAGQYVASQWLIHGNAENARNALNDAQRYNPHEVVLKLQLLILDCLQKKPMGDRIKQVISDASISPFDSAAIDALRALQEDIATHQCPGLTYDDLHVIHRELLKNQKFQYRKDASYNLYFLDGTLYVKQRLLNEAMDQFDNAYRALPNTQLALIQARLLLSAGLNQPALEYIALARKTKPLYPWLLPSDEDEIDRIEKLARKD